MKELRFCFPTNHYSKYVEDDFNMAKFYKEIDLKNILLVEKDDKNQFPGIVNLSAVTAIVLFDVKELKEAEISVCPEGESC